MQALSDRARLRELIPQLEDQLVALEREIVNARELARALLQELAAGAAEIEGPADGATAGPNTVEVAEAAVAQLRTAQKLSKIATTAVARSKGVTKWL